MPKKRYTPEEIVAKLRQVDVLVSQRRPSISSLDDSSKATSDWKIRRRTGPQFTTIQLRSGALPMCRPFSIPTRVLP